MSAVACVVVIMYAVVECVFVYVDCSAGKEILSSVAEILRAVPVGI